MKDAGDEATAVEAAADDPMAFLEEAAAGQTPKKSGSKDKIRVDVPQVDAQITAFIEASKEAHAAGSKMETAKAQILAAGCPARAEALRRAQRMEATVSLNGRIELCVQNRYSAIPAGNDGEKKRITALQQTFGADDFKRYFEQALTIGLKPASTSNKDVLAKLRAALGKEFAQHFDVKIAYKPTEAFHVDVTLRPEVEAKAREFMDSQVIKLAEPSLKPPGGGKRKAKADDDE